MISMEQVVALLEQGFVGTSGRTLFAYKMPENIETGVVALSPLAGSLIDYDLPGFGQHSFQIIARSRQIPAGRGLMRLAMDALTWHRPVTIPALLDCPEILVRRCLPRHEPIIFPRGRSDLIEISVNFDYVAVGGF